MNRRRTFAGISVITMSVLMFELGLTRIFSATMYYHFAFLAIQNNDLPEVMGVTLLAGFFVVVANLVVDILYAVVDPRVRAV